MVLPRALIRVLLPVLTAAAMSFPAMAQPGSQPDTLASPLADGSRPSETAVVQTAGPRVNPLPADGAELARSLMICRNADVTTARIADWRACMGYLAGIINGASAAASILGGDQLFCIPDEITDAALRDALIRYMDENPASAASPMPSAVIDALITIHPCE